jgi:hypothetical protein
VGSQPNHDENARANNRAHAQGRKLENAEGSLQAVLAGFARFLHQQIQWLGSQQVRHPIGFSFVV